MSVSSRNFLARFLFCFVSYHSVIGIQISLTRLQVGDYFNNPYATCDKVSDSDKNFCKATNSICYKKYPYQHSECCYCQCGVYHSTFDVEDLQCSPNQDFRPDCSLRLTPIYDDEYLNSIDLTKDGQKKVTAKSMLPSGPQYNLLSCTVSKLERMNSKGYETVSSHSFGVKSRNKREEFTINWPKSDKESYGRVYRIWFKCQFNRPGQTNGEFEDCLMLKSSGTVRIHHPGLPSGGNSSSELPSSTATTLLRKAATTQPTAGTVTTFKTIATTTRKAAETLTTETSIQIKPTSSVITTSRTNHLSSSHFHEIILTSTAKEHINPPPTFSWHSPTSNRLTNLVPSPSEDEALKIFTPQTPSIAIDIRPYPEETTSRSTSNIGIEVPNLPDKEERSSASDGKMVVYIVVVVVVVIAIIVLAVLVRCTMVRKKKTLKKRESRVDIVMSDTKKDFNEDEDGYYTSLDKTAGNDESNYEPLSSPGANKNQTIRDAYNEKMRQRANEGIYADADRVYSTIDPQIDDVKICAKSNLAFDVNGNERVYSILEQQPDQIDYITPTIGDNKERVCSILEEETGKIAHPLPIIRGHMSADQGCTVDADEVYSTIEDTADALNVDPESNYVTILPPEKDASQLDCAVYADLSEQRDRNEYQSLVKRKK